MGTDYCSSPHYSYVSHPCETHVAFAFAPFRYSRETRPRDVRRLSSSETSAVVVSVDVWIRRLFSHASHASLGERGGEIDAHSFHGSLRRCRVDEAVRFVVVVVVFRLRERARGRRAAGRTPSIPSNVSLASSSRR